MTKRPHTCAKKYLPSIGQTVRPTSRQPHPPPHYEAIPLRIVFIPPYPTYIPTSNHHHLKWPLLAASILLCVLILAASTRTKTSHPLRSLPLIWWKGKLLLQSFSVIHVPPACWPLADGGQFFTVDKHGLCWQKKAASGSCLWQVCAYDLEHQESSMSVHNDDEKALNGHGWGGQRNLERHIFFSTTVLGAIVYIIVGMIWRQIWTICSKVQCRCRDVPIEFLPIMALMLDKLAYEILCSKF